MDRNTYTSNLRARAQRCRNYLITSHKAEIEKLKAEIEKLKADRAPVPKMVDASTQTDMVSQTKPKIKTIMQTKPKITPLICHAIMQSGPDFGKECGRPPRNGGPYCGWHDRS